MDSDYVLLAFTERERVRESNTLFKENVIGGKPFFSPHLSQELVDASLNSQTLTCSGCHSIISFIAQISCPVDDDSDRVVHVFACVSKSCPDKKWLVTRTISPMIEFDEKPVSNGKLKEWLTDEDDWEDEDEDEDEDEAESDNHQQTHTSQRLSAKDVGENQSASMSMKSILLNPFI